MPLVLGFLILLFLYPQALFSLLRPLYYSQIPGLLLRVDIWHSLNPTSIAEVSPASVLNMPKASGSCSRKPYPSATEKTGIHMVISSEMRPMVIFLRNHMLECASKNPAKNPAESITKTQRNLLEKPSETGGHTDWVQGWEVSRIHRSSQVFTGLHRSSQVFTGLHRFSQVFTGFHKSSQVFTGLHRFSQSMVWEGS